MSKKKIAHKLSVAWSTVRR